MTALTRRAALALGLAALGGCGETGGGASPEEIAAARYASAAPPYLALVSMVLRENGRAAHTGLVVNGSHRIVYDPAGTFGHPALPERGDVHYGLTDRYLDYYERYHARRTYFVHVQQVGVAPEVAEIALRRTEAQGASFNAFCAIHTARILRDVPGFGGIAPTFFPETLRRQMAEIPGVADRYVYEDDVGKALPSAP